MANQRVMYTLFEKYLAGNCSATEIQTLVELFGTPGDEAMLKQLIREALESQPIDPLMQDRVDAFTARVGNHLAEAIRTPPQQDTPVRVLYPKRFIAIAASLLILCAAGMALYYAWQPDEPLTPMLVSEYGADVLPGGNRATLTLANGKTIELSAQQTGLIVADDGMMYVDGSLVVDGIRQLAEEDGKRTSRTAESELRTSDVGLLTLTTPKGGQYMVTLPDGSNVWLNAASLLKYPTKFTGKERRVELEGEAYFEVKRNGKQPFIVQSGQQEVRVLGTQFNVNAYTEEPITTTTLVDGAVQVLNRRSNVVSQLQPGKQTIVQDGDTRINAVDVSSFVNWKQGLFTFKETEIRDVMNQLGRWYDVEVVYEKPIPPTHFFGDINRDKSLAQVLNILKKSGVNFRIEHDKDREQNKLIVLP